MTVSSASTLNHFEYMLSAENANNFPHPKFEITISSELFMFLKVLISETVEEAIAKKSTTNLNSTSDWITPEEARKLLPLKSKSSWQKLRDQQKIVFTQPFKNVILYSRASLLKFIEQHKVKSM